MFNNCWIEPELNPYLPPGYLLVVGGPDSTVIRLKNCQAPEPHYILESSHSESYTRILLHTNGMSIDQCQNKVIVATTK